MSLEQLCQATIAEVASLLEQKKVSPVELTQAMLGRIDKYDSVLHSYITPTPDNALTEAKKAEAEILKGEYRGPLHGVPLALKDLLYTRDAPTTCASAVLKNWVPDYNATAVDRLYQAGAISLGKLSMTEFAQGGYHPDIPPPKNPWNPNHWSGLSSSGSAVAAAASLCFGALGTDTGGSIRYPAAACGVVGLKPTYGRVSRYGAFPLAESLDHIGPMTRSVADAAILLEAIAGYDPMDPTSLKAPVPLYSDKLKDHLTGVRVGVDERYCIENVVPEVAAAVMTAIDTLVELGAKVVPLNLCELIEICDYWYPVTAAEAAAAHNGFYPTQADSYGPTFRALLEWGHRYTALDVTRSIAAKTKAWQVLENAFAKVDVIACPTMAMPAPPVEAFPPDMVAPPEAIPPLLHFTAPFNFTGHPTLSLPCGFAGDLPLSLQLIGDHCGESEILQVGYAYEQATEWHQQRPMLSAEA